MKRAFKTKTFCRWMSKAGLDDDTLREAIAEMEAGLIDADLGGGLVKKRVHFQGRGNVGVRGRLSLRIIVAFGFSSLDTRKMRERISASRMRKY